MQQMGWSKVLVAKLRKYRTALRRLTGLECVWALERNGKNARLHEQEVWSGFLELGLVAKAKRKVEGIGRCNVKEGFDPFYLAKEMGKRVGCRGNGSKHFGAMGNFEGKCGMRDFVLESPAGEVRKYIWATREANETSAHMWQVREREVYESWLAGAWSLGPEWDKYREACASGYRKVFGERGDAWEDEDGDADFDVGELEDSAALGVVPQQAEPVARPKAAEGGAS
jgi:hypothetical protein